MRQLIVFLWKQKAGQGICRSGTLPWCSHHMNMSSKCSECHPRSWCLACRYPMLRHRDLLSQHALLCTKPTNHESSLLLSLPPFFLSLYFPPSLLPLMCVFSCNPPGPCQEWCSGSDPRDLGRAASTLSQLTLWSLENLSVRSLPSTITWMKRTMTPLESLQGASGSTVITTTSGWVCAPTLFSLAFISGEELLLSLYLGL